LARSEAKSALDTLRRDLIRRRERIDPTAAAEAARRVSQRLWRLPLMARCQSIGCYLAVRGELDCGPLIATAIARRRSVLVPVLNGRQLVFAPYVPGSDMVGNRFGIPEPAESGRAWARGMRIDVALVPLVGFDRHGQRLGMGAGYYDRTFRFLMHRRHWRRPMLIGLAYEFQRVDALPRRAWDVPLDAVVTDSHVYRVTSDRGATAR
jgi:5-formyltetrahydrofolate cyclo-ligase